ncbi:hypothetical protein KDAU_08420 [Dictyobacter aurantiacus]|uniref:Uncharacterized protein n=1 Tax=Dictyobacter aurantiacus TaxID=1936993 RepID=A0A401Z9M5_9CHLR|nr:hypothetical protein KDAU_08420 [Dictyobacter aurantiacus]
MMRQRRESQATMWQRREFQAMVRDLPQSPESQAQRRMPGYRANLAQHQWSSGNPELSNPDRSGTPNRENSKELIEQREPKGLELLRRQMEKWDRERLEEHSKDLNKDMLGRYR